MSDIAVVGGGLAGISAALACADAGAKVTLFEKRSQLGGLTRSFNHDGLCMDNGQHVFLRCCTAYLDFLDRIGSAGDVELQDSLQVSVLRRHQDPATISRSSWPAPLHLSRSLLAYRPVPWQQRLRLGLAAVPLRRLDLDDPALDEQTFATWLSTHHQTRAAIGALWDLICLPTVNLPAEEASLAMAAKVFQTGLLSDKRAGDIGWSRLPLGRLHGERSATALRKAGVDVRRGCPVDAVRPFSPPPGAPESAGFAVQAGGTAHRADGVVVALPHHLVEAVLPDGALPAGVRPSQLGSSPIVNVHVHLDRRVTDLPFAAGLGEAAQWIFDRTTSSGATTGQYLAVSISGADRYGAVRPAQLADEVVESVRALFPAAGQAKVLGTLVTKEQHATFRATPGSAQHRAPARTRLPGLALAGAWTSTGWPPTMESAVRSGIAAARAVLVATGHRNALPSLPREAA